MGLYEQDTYGDLGRLLQMEDVPHAAHLVVRHRPARQTVELRSSRELHGRGHRPAAGRDTSRSGPVMFSIPGQATAYYVGFLKTLELRQKAQTSLGNRFDREEFHDVMLVNGADVPLDVLERLVDIRMSRAGNGR